MIIFTRDAPARRRHEGAAPLLPLLCRACRAGSARFTQIATLPRAARRRAPVSASRQRHDAARSGVRFDFRHTFCYTSFLHGFRCFSLSSSFISLRRFFSFSLITPLLIAFALFRLVMLSVYGAQSERQAPGERLRLITRWRRRLWRY